MLLGDLLQEPGLTRNKPAKAASRALTKWEDICFEKIGKPGGLDALANHNFNARHDGAAGRHTATGGLTSLSAFDRPPNLLRERYATAPNALAIPSNTSSSGGCVSLPAASGENCPLAAEAAECGIMTPISSSTGAISAGGLMSGK